MERVSISRAGGWDQAHDPVRCGQNSTIEKRESYVPRPVGRSCAGAAGGLWHCRPDRTERPFLAGRLFAAGAHYRGGNRWAVWVPAGLGVLGLALSCLFVLEAIPWAVSCSTGPCIFCGSGLSGWSWRRCKKSVGRLEREAGEGPPLTRINGVSFDRRGLFRQCRTCFWRRKKVRGAYVSAPGPVGGSAPSGDFGHL